MRWRRLAQRRRHPLAFRRRSQRCARGKPNRRRRRCQLGSLRLRLKFTTKSWTSDRARRFRTVLATTRSASNVGTRTVSNSLTCSSARITRAVKNLATGSNARLRCNAPTAPTRCNHRASREATQRVSATFVIFRSLVTLSARRRRGPISPPRRMAAYPCVASCLIARRPSRI